jgi:pimeloyl-ACP methyl ester carboxylesterase
VIAPDWLGFGQTDKVHDFVSGQLRRLEHMRRFLEEAQVGPAAFVGNSMGGLLLARAVARTEPLWPTEALAIVSAGGFSPDNEARNVLVNYDASVEGMRAILQVLFHDERFANDEEYLKRRYEISTVPGAWECAAAARFRSPLATVRPDYGIPDSTEWELINVPTLFVAGEKDPLKEPGYAAELATRVPDGRVLVYSDCGHAPNIEVADQFNADLLAFLAEVYPANQ